jgi:hypothetical protein
MKNLPFKPEVITDVVREVSTGMGADVTLKALEGGAAAA